MSLLLLAQLAVAQGAAPRWAPVEVTAEGAHLRLHLVHRDVIERTTVGDERWELLESGIVVRRGPDGALLSHFLDCRVTDLVENLRLCGDGRVLSLEGEVGRFAPNPARAIPWEGGLLAAVSLPEGVALQRLGHDPVVVKDPGEGYPDHLLAHEGQLYGAWDREVVRIDPDTGQTWPVLYTDFDARRLVVSGGQLVVQGRWSHGEHGRFVQQVVPRDPDELAEAQLFPAGDLPVIPSLELERGPEIQGELAWSMRELHQTRWGLFARGIPGYGMGPELLGAEGWQDLPVEGEWELGLDGELYALRGHRDGVTVLRWNGAALEEQTWLPTIHDSGFRLGLDEVFMGPDGRWWVLGLMDKRAHAWDGQRWVDLGHSLPVNFGGVRARDDHHLYAGVEHQLWRWTAAGFELIADGVVAESTPEGVLTWDGSVLRRGENVLLEDPLLVVARVARDGCGRIWLMGRQVVVLEAGRAVHIEHPLLDGSVWAFGDATREGAVLSDGRLVVEVVRTCPEE